MERRLTSHAAASDGIALIELLAAILVLAVGVLTTFAIFDASQRANRVSELHEAEVHLAQGELERVAGLPYSQVGLTAAPATSSSRNNPGFYVSGSGCANFQWNQSSGGSSSPLVVNGCSYVSTGVTFSGCSPLTTYCNGTVAPSRTVASTPTSPQYTIYDYITWNQDPVCVPTPNVCPLSYDTKRVTVEVVNNDTHPYRPVQPVLVSGIVADPHALPLVGNPNVNNPLNNPGTTCTDSSGNPVVPCNNGLGGQTANTWYLTNTILQSTGTSYTPPSGNNPCMHYTDQNQPLLGLLNGCGSGSLGTCTLLAITGCPQPDLLWSAPPPSSITQEFNFSPNLSSSTSGRVILRDPNATGSTPAAACGATPSNDARMAEWWSTPPLSSGLNLSGSGGLTLYTNALHGLSVSVTLCIGVYLETPKTLLGTTILDPLNLLGTNTVRLGVAAYTIAAWPAVPTPISFTFSNLFSAQAAAAGLSLGVRVWVAASSGDDIVVHYDAPTVRSSVQINSQ
jgi:hypothetical protein